MSVGAPRSDGRRFPDQGVLFLKREEVAEILGVHSRTLEAWAEGRDGIFGPPAFTPTSSSIRYDRGALLEWLDSQYDGDPGVDRSGDLLLDQLTVADMLRVTTRTVSRWLSGSVAGLAGPAVIRISATTVRWWESDVLAWTRSLHDRRSSEDHRKAIRSPLPEGLAVSADRCSRGHETPDWYTDPSGRRRCRECLRENRRRREEARRG